MEEVGGRKGGKRIDPDGAWLTADEAVTRDESSRDETRRDETRRDETRRDQTRLDETKRDETRRDETRRDETGRYSWTDGRTNERTNGRTDGRTDGPTDGRTNERRRPHSDLPLYPGSSWRVAATGWIKRRAVVDSGERVEEDRGDQRTEDRGAARETREILLTSPSGPSRCETVPRLYVHGRIAWPPYRDTILSFLLPYFSRIRVHVYIPTPAGARVGVFYSACDRLTLGTCNVVMHACAFTSFGSVVQPNCLYRRLGKFLSRTRNSRCFGELLRERLLLLMRDALRSRLLRSIQRFSNSPA